MAQRPFAALLAVYAGAALGVQLGVVPSGSPCALLLAGDQLLLDRAETLLVREPPRAVIAYQGLLGRDPASPRRWADLADAYDLANRRTAAAACYERAAAAGPALASTLVRATHFHVAAGNGVRAAALTGRILRLAPSYGGHLLDLHIRTGTDPALLLSALADNPDAVGAYLRRLLAADRYETAERIWASLKARSLLTANLRDDYAAALSANGLHKRAADLAGSVQAAPP